MHRIWMPMLLTGCLAATPDETPTLPDQAGPPLVLTVPDLYEGDTFTVTVQGATPGDYVGVAAAPGTATPGVCPPYLHGTCLPLSTPAWLGIRRANAQGRITLQVTVPPFLEPGDLVWFQAAAVHRQLPAYTSSRTVRQVLAADCPDIVDAFWTEADAIRACTTAADCGQELGGTSCGCTRNWVAALGADTRAFYDLLGEAGSCGVALASTCDCPPVNGFACIDNTCTWDYAF